MTPVEPPTFEAVRRRADAQRFPANEPIPVAQSMETGEWFVGTTVVSVVGLDLTPGGPEPLQRLAADARTTIELAGLVAGGRWHLDAVASLLRPDCRTIELSGDLDAALDEVAAYGGGVVLASGDPGFFGVLRALRERLPAERVRVRPAVSSVAAVCAAAGVPWDDAVVVSAHGRDPRTTLAVCRRHPKVVVLTAPGFGPQELVAGLGGARRVLHVGARLGNPDTERRATIDTGHPPRAWEFADPNVVLVLDPDAAPSTTKVTLAGGHRPRGPWALDEEEFDHRDGMITKAEVRALALSWLGPGVGDLIWDVGAGSGSVAVECSRLGAAVIAIERDARQCERVGANAARHGAPVDVVHGSAPAALAGLPTPDAVFVGGGGEVLPAVLADCAARGPRVVVVALAAVQRVGPATAALEGAGLAVDGTLLAASRLAPLGEAGATRLAAANPVFLLRGRRP